MEPKKGRLAKPAKGAGRYRVKVHVTSPHVKNVTGKVVITVDGKRLSDKIRSKEHGKSIIALPKNLKEGKHKVKVSYTGSNTVAKSQAKPVKVKVT
jgi:methionine-rich copper-binding protein CopC